VWHCDRYVAVSEVGALQQSPPTVPAATSSAWDAPGQAARGGGWGERVCRLTTGTPCGGGRQGYIAMWLCVLCFVCDVINGSWWLLQ
jgi:hypothetical protein